MMNVVSHYHPALETRADVNERYPYRVPDWFWQTPEKAFTISPEDYVTFVQDIGVLVWLERKVPLRNKCLLN
jgi:hypothetical protein